MRLSEVIFVVRKQSDVDLLKDLVGASGGMRRVIVQVMDDANSLTPQTLRRLRRLTDPVKRRTVVVVWVSDAQEAERWRNAGALTVSSKLSAAGAAKALEKSALVPWVESAGYIGPDRRHKRSWLNRAVRRLDDTEVGRQPDKAAHDTSSFETRMRQLRLASLGMNGADRERRAQFRADVRSAIQAAEAARRLHAAKSMESLSRYLAARGATGVLDQTLIEKHLEAAEAPAAEGTALVQSLQRSVDRAIGLGQPG